VLSLPLFCHAQGADGLVTGVVTDATGAVITHAAVRAINTATNVVTEAESNVQGNYTLDFLAPGEYKIAVEKQGFKRFERSSVTVRVHDRIGLDIQLTVGDRADQVVVEAGTPLLDTASSSLGSVADNRRIEDLPLKHGNPLMLEFLAPGIVFDGNVTFTRPYDNAASESAVNGSRLESTEYTLDGIPDTFKRVSAYTPSVEFVQEFRVETATYDASLGHSAGGWVSMSLKSGSNQIHGSLYEFLQNPILDSNLFFNNKAGLAKPHYTFNRWGGAAGGPVRKDKLFWFFGYEGMILRDIENAAALTIPTPAEKTGDFSALLNLGSQYQIYDPASTTSMGNGHYSRTPFTGNIIPASRITSAGQKIIDNYPAPNQKGGADGSANYYYGKTEPDKYYTFSTRVDEVINAKQRLFGHFIDSSRKQGPYRYYFPNASGENLYFKNRGAAIDYLYTLGPQTVLDARYGYTRFVSIHIPQTTGFDSTTLGLPAWIQNSTPAASHVFPDVTPAGYQGLSTENPDGTYADIHTFSGTVSRSQGNHLIRAGAEFREYLVNYHTLAYENGIYNFGGYMNGPIDNSSASPLGQGAAGLLLGIVSSGSLTLNDSYAARTRFGGLFVQDDWKVSRRLTVNMGLRWEYEGPVVERYNRSVRGYDYNTASPLQASAVANYANSPIPEMPASQFKVMGGLTYAGVNGQPRGLWDPFTHDFAPRVGFAYSIDPSTVLRVGYGIFYDSIGVTTQGPIQSGYSQTTTLVATQDNGQIFTATLANPFPNGLTAPTGNKSGISTFLGSTISFFNTHPRRPYNQRWSVNLQRKILGQFVVDLSYVGNRGTDLGLVTVSTSNASYSRQLDGIPDQYLSTSPVRDNAVYSRLTTSVPNPFYPNLPGTSLSGSTAYVSQLLLPYPQFTGMTTMSNQGYSWYHSLQVRAEKRFAKGYTIAANWTWAKNMDAMAYLNSMDPVPARSISTNDRTNRFSINGIYELPFGKDRRFAPGASGLPGKLIGGWQVQSTYQYQTGQPLGLGDFISYCSGSNIPIAASKRTISQWFNTSCIERNSSLQYVDHLRTTSLYFSGLRSAPNNYLDLSLIKKTNIGERLNLLFRAEAVNALNHTVFSAPVTTITSSTFGQVTSSNGLSRTIQFSLTLRF
jgi:hypothetical protein